MSAMEWSTPTRNRKWALLHRMKGSANSVYGTDWTQKEITQQCVLAKRRTLHHNEARNVLAKAIKEVRYDVKYEHAGGFSDGRKPGT